MGKKKAAAPEAKVEEKAPEPVKPPEPEKEEVKKEKIVVDLEAIDDQYLALEREYEKAVQELQKKYTERQAPLLEERKTLLCDTSGDVGEAGKLGTPACKGFWLQAIKNLPGLEDQVEEWDEPVLEYLRDVTKSYVDESNLHKGFKLSFHFVENPYFTNEVIWKEYYTEESSPYTGEIDTTEIKSCTIEWKPSMNVTVEKVAKKTKGGGAKKNKQKEKQKEEIRDSFFRSFFRNLKPDMPIPDDVNLDEARQMVDGDSDEDEEELLNLLMENDYEIGTQVRDQLVPFAVRFYTGEACPDDYDDDDDDDDLDEDDDDDDDDDDEDDDDSEDEPAPKRKAQAKKRPSGEGEKKKGGGGDGKAPAGAKAEECKQQ